MLHGSSGAGHWKVSPGSHRDGQTDGKSRPCLMGHPPLHLGPTWFADACGEEQLKWGITELGQTFTWRRGFVCIHNPPFSAVSSTEVQSWVGKGSSFCTKTPRLRCLDWGEQGCRRHCVDTALSFSCQCGSPAWTLLPTTSSLELQMALKGQAHWCTILARCPQLRLWLTQGRKWGHHEL